MILVGATLDVVDEASDLHLMVLDPFGQFIHLVPDLLEEQDLVAGGAD
jgi:hypothetical protein